MSDTNSQPAAEMDPVVYAAVSLLRSLTTAYTRHHEQLETEGRKVGSQIMLTIRAHADDHPKLVGSKGKHIWALQQIFQAAGRRAGETVQITLLPPVHGQRGRELEYVENEHWTPDNMAELLEMVLEATTISGVLMDPQDVGGMTTFLLVPGDANDPAARWDEKPGLAHALHLLFHAIGKTQGHIVHVQVEAEKPSGQAV